MQGIKAIETRFFRSHMTGCDLSGALLLDCDLRCVDLTRARLTGAQILDSQFYWPNPIRESQPWYCGEGLSGAKLNQADLRGCRLNVTIDGTDFSAADLRLARSEENTSELQSLMRISYAVLCMKKKIQ